MFSGGMKVEHWLNIVFFHKKGISLYDFSEIPTRY